MKVFTNLFDANQTNGVFNFDDFSELNFNQLIEVNGGCGGSYYSSSSAVGRCSGGSPAYSVCGGSSVPSCGSSSKFLLPPQFSHLQYKYDALYTDKYRKYSYQTETI